MSDPGAEPLLKIADVQSSPVTWTPRISTVRVVNDDAGSELIVTLPKLTVTTIALADEAGNDAFGAWTTVTTPMVVVTIVKFISGVVDPNRSLNIK